MSGMPIDVLINNAGLFGPKAVAEKDSGHGFGSIRYEMLEEVWRTNTVTPLRLIHFATGIGVRRPTATAVTLFWGEPSMTRSE